MRSHPSTQSRYQKTLDGLRRYIAGEITELSPETRPYIESLIRWVNKRPFATASGFVGLGPADTREGDTIAILDGFDACYVLREDLYPRGMTENGLPAGKADQNRHTWGAFRVIGEAYVDGLMDGEAFIDVHCAKIIDLV